MAIDLEQALVELADTLEFPGEQTLAERVLTRLDEPERTAVVAAWPRPWVRRMLAVAAAAILVVALVLVVSPRARRAVADLLGIGGVEIRGSSATTTQPTSVPPTFPTTLRPDILGLGQPVSPAAGAARLGIAPPLPTGLGPPDASYFSPSPRPNGELTLVWSPGQALPPTKVPGVGALLTVFEATLEEGYFGKVLDPGTTYEKVSVNGRPAAWLAGAPHSFLYPTANNGVEEEQLRLAGNTLIWAEGPFTYRLESALDRDAAIAVAESIPA